MKSTLMRAQRPAATASVSGVCSLRVKPFTPLARPLSSRNIRTRAAEVDAAPAAEEDLDFVFSLSDAKKNNEYSSSDVDAAMRFYLDGEGTQPAADAEFTTNYFGVVEDASYFDEFDNNEAYENDEYIVAGIPEAAPKKRRGPGRGEVRTIARAWLGDGC